MYEISLIVKGMELNDMVDILLVATVFYGIFALLRGTRSPAALQGLVIMLVGSFVIYSLASVFQLTALREVFRSFWVIAVLLFIVVFQHDFRRSLMQVGQLRIFRHLFPQSTEYLPSLAESTRLLVKNRIGALIALERRNSLRVFADTGKAIDSAVSPELIRSIFTPTTPLHDGAIILRDDRILAANCILPLSTDPEDAKIMGTRHLAAIGLSEETDAVVIVVSEETGAVSLAVGGKLERGISIETLLERLKQEMESEGGKD